MTTPAGAPARPRRRALLAADHDGYARLALGRSILRVHRRTLLIALVLAALVTGLALVAMTWGDYPLSVPEVIRALVTDQGFVSTIVIDWRLPRVLAAVLFGAALGVSGALFQTLTRNPLGSPDVIGFSTGAYTGAIISITVVGANVLSEMAGALIGGLAAALLVYVLAWRGGVQGFRLIIVGIAVTAVLSSLNTYLLLRAQTEVAMAASLWGAGSIALVGWSDLALQAGRAYVVPDDVKALAVPVLAVCGVLTACVVPPLRQLELGDDAARAHGVRTEPVRIAVLFAGVALIAIVTALTGPIAFIALAAPQITKRLARGAGIPVGASAFTGALLLLGADLVAQHVIPGSVPVGVVTVVIGGLYLIVLLVQEARAQL